MTALTAYPDVNALLDDILQRVPPILGDDLLGVYLFGSLTLNAFHPDSSDVDLLIVTRSAIDEAMFKALQAAHCEIFALDNPHAEQIEFLYPTLALAQGTISSARGMPFVDRGACLLERQDDDDDWAIMRQLAYENGVTVIGQPVREVFKPVPQATVLARMRFYVDLRCQQLTDADYREAVAGTGGLCYIVMTMCRMLYTVNEGAITSKDQAVAWALDNLPSRWHATITLAGTHRNGTPLLSVDNVAAFVAYTVAAIS